MFAKIKKLKGIYWIIFLHILIGFLCSFFFFQGLEIEAGWENRAYAYLWSGESLREDKLSRMLCFLASYVLAIVLIWLLWKFLFYFWERLKEKKVSSILFLVVLIAGLFLILCLYPEMFGVETTDDYMNYVYARELLPMYWHGFLTNVVYIACMIVFPHPVSIPIIQFIFGVSVLFYIGGTFMTRVSGKKKAKTALVSCFFLLIVLLPETIRILIYPTRNCMYAIVCLWALGILFVDGEKNGELTKRKFTLLVFLFAVLGSWRGEGILYLLAFPFLIYFTYEQKSRKKLLSKAHGKQLLFYLTICILFMLPDKYGVNKYQNSDYMIANTTGPISAVLHDEGANVSYDGIKEDLEHIAEVIPLEYIYQYGCNGGFYYNAISGRWVRQSGTSKLEGRQYISSAYRLLLYNLPDYLKYQWNLFLDANSIKGMRLSVDFGSETMENVRELQPYARAFELYDAGEENLETYDLKLGGKETKAFLAKYIPSGNYKKSLDNSGIAGIIKLVLAGGMIFTAFVALFKKNYQYFLISALNLAVLAVIILMAPWSRPNYYYSVFFNMYGCLLYGFYMRLEK